MIAFLNISIIKPLKLTIMKTLNLLKINLLLISCFLLMSTVGCKKSSVAEITDPGYGCNTSVIQATITNYVCSVIYVPAQSSWVMSVNYPTYGFFIIPSCANSSTFKTVTDKHALTDIFNVTVSGNIKYRIAGQKTLPENTSYPDFYLIDITAVTEK
jgi:hypothetical protein